MENKKLAFVLDNVNLLNGEFVDKMYQHIFIKKIVTEFPVYINPETGELPKILSGRYGKKYLDFDKTLLENINILQQLIKQKGVSVQEFFSFYPYSYMFSWDCLCYNYENKMRYTLSYGLGHMLNVITYAMTGKTEDKVSDCYLFLDNNYPRLTWKEHKFQIRYMGLNIIRYKNSRLDIVGLDPIQQGRLDRMFELAKIFNIL